MPFDLRNALLRKGEYESTPADCTIGRTIAPRIEPRIEEGLAAPLTMPASQAALAGGRAEARFLSARAPSRAWLIPRQDRPAPVRPD